MCLRCCGYTLPGFARWRYFVDMWVAEGHTSRWSGSVCWLYITFRCGCRPASGMSTPSRCRALVHNRCQWCRDRLGRMVLRGCVCVCVAIAVVGPTMVTPQDRGGLGMIVRFGRTLWCICVVAVIDLCDRRVGTSWPHTQVVHDDPDRRPNRSALTLTGPSQILRCGFGKGTPLIAAGPLSWVSPCIISCCHCRGA